VSAARKEVGQLMVVNDTPDEECRIAVLQEGKLESLFMERQASATQVGNIYKGRVTNVEPAIQAAFVDFGESQAGFLHISDLHPRYFPKGDGKERVGKKTPRRDRPMMQEALRRGDEVLVQVLKQGLGTKGPTLTSYLSIPGRLLVMMPGMDRSGVSRKVEDEEQRRTMRKILDSLNLPDGFGFILRTAGFDRTKTELQRDAAYLTRLWKVMEKRIDSVGAPCALYTESDLLIRTIRDVVDSSIEAIVVDSASAFSRAQNFLEVVAPRSAPKVLHYDRAVPIFHAFDIERQIELTHAREVPLPSGGALVIDQTEALVAIDVNSGRSRSARDSETNAFRTNCEAVDEIARQIRLRDLGGVIVNDLIDMRSVKHRREIEERFRACLKRDRARTTVAQISEFGILEMTRQRMRPSLRKAHYIDCPHCSGHGEIKMPDSVASDAMRQIGFLLDFDRVHRIEMVCSSRVASVLLSMKRRVIDRLEDRTGKRIDVRISEAIPVDRVDLYAYDERNADIDVEKLPRTTVPKLDSMIESLPPDHIEAPVAADGGTGGGRRRRRRRRPGPADATAIALAGGFDDFDDGDDRSALEAVEADEAAAESRSAAAEADDAADGGGSSAGAAGEESSSRRRRRRRRRRKGGDDAAAPGRESDRKRETRLVPPEPVVVDDRPRRIHELAKELEVTSKEILARCAETEGVDAKSHSSSVSPEIAAIIRSWYAPLVEVVSESPADPPADPPAESERRVDEGSRADSREGGEGTRRRRRRRRRRGGRTDGDDAAVHADNQGDTQSDANGHSSRGARDPESSSDSDAPSRTTPETADADFKATPDATDRGATTSEIASRNGVADGEVDDAAESRPKRGRRRRGRGKDDRDERPEKRPAESKATSAAANSDPQDGAVDSDATPVKKKRPRRKSSGRTSGGATGESGGDKSESQSAAQSAAPKSSASTSKSTAAKPAVSPIRPLYGAGRTRKVSPTAKAEAMRKEVPSV